MTGTLEQLDALATEAARRVREACVGLFDLPPHVGTVPLTALEHKRIRAGLAIAQATLDTSQTDVEANYRLAALRPYAWALTDPNADLPMN